MPEDKLYNLSCTMVVPSRLRTIECNHPGAVEHVKRIKPPELFPHKSHSLLTQITDHVFEAQISIWRFQESTLLSHILQSKDHGLKIALIVNDMAELNIDGAQISRLDGAKSGNSSKCRTDVSAVLFAATS